ncbi:MAG: Amuc_1099 family pilus-like system protein, partial [Chthoniobacterales bacterium]
MEWVRSNHDRAAVLVATVFLLLCAVFIFLRAGSFEEQFSAIENAAAPNNAIPVGHAPEIVETMHYLQNPPQWRFRGHSGLFVPEKHFIGTDGQPTTLKNTQLHPPVPNEWLEESGLPIAEDDVLTQDPDGDGFSNLDEWEGKSNPTDESSHPPYTALLRLRSFAQEQFPLVFTSSVGDTFGINNLDRNKPTQFLKVGDLVRGTKFKITGYTEKYDTDRNGATVDVSELAVEQIGTHEQITLVKEKTATSPELVATFVYMWGGTSELFAVKKDQEFSLKPRDEITYKLLE